MLCPNKCLRLHRNTEAGQRVVHSATRSKWSLAVSSCPSGTQWMLLGGCVRRSSELEESETYVRPESLDLILRKSEPLKNGGHFRGLVLVSVWRMDQSLEGMEPRDHSRDYCSNSIRIKEGQMLARMRSDRNSHLLLVGMKNGTATLENSLAVSYKIKYTHTIQPNNLALRYLLKKSENLYRNI